MQFSRARLLVYSTHFWREVLASLLCAFMDSSVKWLAFFISGEQFRLAYYVHLWIAVLIGLLFSFLE